jgi:DNA-binding protein H-NS
MARSAQSGEQLDLENMSDEQLRELRRQVDRILDTRVRSRFDEFRRAAREAGYEATFTRIGEEGGRSRRGRPGGREDRRSEIAPKYRNPENPSETWSGRGREPKWLQHQIAEGKSKEDFLIDRPPAGGEATT